VALTDLASRRRACGIMELWLIDNMHWVALGLTAGLVGIKLMAMRFLSRLTERDEKRR
jgi:hypothetical protein